MRLLSCLPQPWREIYETDSERKRDFDEAKRTFVQMTEVYRDCGYEAARVTEGFTGIPGPVYCRALSG